MGKSVGPTRIRRLLGCPASWEGIATLLPLGKWNSWSVSRPNTPAIVNGPSQATYTHCYPPMALPTCLLTLPLHSRLELVPRSALATWVLWVSVVLPDLIN